MGHTFLQQILNALQLGSIYALIAIGYNLVYGVAHLINFAHGDVFGVSTYVIYFAGIALMASGLSTPFVVTLVIIIAMGSIALLGVGINFLAYKPLRSAPRVSAVVTALSVGIALENLTLAIVGPNIKKIPKFLPRYSFRFANTDFNSNQLLIIVSAFILMFILDRFMMKTQTGRAMRALTYDKRTPYLLGISVEKIISLTFALGSAAAAFAAFLYTIAYPLTNPYIGLLLGWWCFIAAVAGGIGSIRGAMLGGLLLGFIMIFVPVILPSTYRDLIAFSLLILVLIIKPNGILGRIETQKV